LIPLARKESRGRISAPRGKGEESRVEPGMDVKTYTFLKLSLPIQAN
jgi:hypothetical protein